MSTQQTLTLTLPEEVLEALARRVAALLAKQVSVVAAPATPWLDVQAACAHLGFSRDRLYKLTAARAIPFRKKRDGQGLLFHRGELDRWLEQQYPQEGWLP